MSDTSGLEALGDEPQDINRSIMKLVEQLGESEDISALLHTAANLMESTGYKAAGNVSKLIVSEIFLLASQVEQLSVRVQKDSQAV